MAASHFYFIFNPSFSDCTFKGNVLLSQFTLSSHCETPPIFLQRGTFACNITFEENGIQQTWWSIQCHQHTSILNTNLPVLWVNKVIQWRWYYQLRENAVFKYFIIRSSIQMTMVIYHVKAFRVFSPDPQHRVIIPPCFIPLFLYGSFQIDCDFKIMWKD